MAKFILIMFICSGIPGNQCKLMPTFIQDFGTYRECAIYGYEYSFNMLKAFSVEAVNDYKIYTAFNCKENPSI